MNKEVRDELVKNWLKPEDEKFLDEAVNRINFSEIERGFDITRPQNKQVEGSVIENDDDVPIEYVIERLNKFKDKGYKYVGYDDWDDDLIVYKFVKETVEECAERIHERIMVEINILKSRVMTHEKKLAKLEKLKKEISKLEEELKNE